MLDNKPIETKAHGGDVAGAFDEFMRALKILKETNDTRLADLERRSSADVVTTEKLDRIDRALDEHRRVVDDLALKAVRPPLGGDRSVSKNRHDIQHKAAFDAYVRKGEAGGLPRNRGRKRCPQAPILTAATSCRKTPNALSTAR